MGEPGRNEDAFGRAAARPSNQVPAVNAIVESPGIVQNNAGRATLLRRYFFRTWTVGSFVPPDQPREWEHRGARANRGSLVKTG